MTRRWRIGLYLGVDPTVGGTFQYNQTLLDAVAALPQDEFEALVLYVFPQWQPVLRDYSLERRQVRTRETVAKLVKPAVFNTALLDGVRVLSPVLQPAIAEIRRANCDLWVFPSQDAVTFQAGVPAVGVIHDLMHRYDRRFPEAGSFFRATYRDGHYRAMWRHAAAVFVNSELGKRHVLDSYGGDESRLLVLPYVAARHVHVQTTPEGFDERYRLPKKFFFYPAQFWQHKNHRGLLTAASMLVGAHPDLQIVLVGSRKNAYDAVQAQIDSLGLRDHVQCLGYVPDPDVAEIYRRARALVMPTFYGPINIPPLEAFALGCPVAASNIYAFPEQIGDAGLLFDPNNPAEIADAMRRLWTDDALCADLVTKGRTRAAAWTQQQLNGQFAEHLRSVLARLPQSQPYRGVAGAVAQHT
jgi:glycosyltransferase involved in cell wall biosynthesis